MKNIFKYLRDQYVLRHAAGIRIPDFAPDEIRRCRILFKGRVQKVGFRLEVYELAQRLQITGYCQNLETGDVLAELQGPGNKIAFLISCMEGLKRARVRSKETVDIPIIPHETAFRKN